MKKINKQAGRLFPHFYHWTFLLEVTIEQGPSKNYPESYCHMTFSHLT